MAPATTRRQLLRADLHGRRRPVRPPWATPRFHADCTRCDACLPACPEGILVRGDGGFPEVDFRRGECTFCGDCVSACSPKALQRTEPSASPWHHVAHVAPACLEGHGVHCRACADPCPEEVVRFRPGTLNHPPEIDVSGCTGCGACVAPCPVQAVHIGPPTSQEVAA
ncbi:MAG: ferredoxin-type protein NapF [Gammaproteobacteria bacterium]|jgi:ferredoxin-type protein NapF|nr:ferredoxin-type protein NapF [Gammaproteobacteria bacterium]